MDHIRVLLVDDKQVVLQSVRQVLESQEDIHVVGEALDGAESLALVKDLLPDVVVLDIAMPGMTGLEALPLIAGVSDQTAVVIFSMYAGEAYILEAFQAGALGYVSKTSPASHLLQAVRLAASGDYYLMPEMKSPHVLSMLQNTFAGPLAGEPFRAGS